MQEYDGDLSNLIVKRLLDKLEQNKEKICLSCACFKQPFQIIQMLKLDPVISKIIKEVEQDYSCQVCEHHALAAFRQFMYAKGQ